MTREADRPTRLRRSLLFVPGGEPKKLAKAASAGADALLLDLEDAVPPAEKERAREHVAAFLRDGGAGDSEPIVRVNPPGTMWFEADVRASVEAGAKALMIPKAESASGMAAVADLAARFEPTGARAPTGLLALVETAAGLMAASEIAASSDRVEALCFGHVDFSRDMQLATADATRDVVLHARSTLVIAGRAARVDPIDTVYVDVRDEAGFETDAALGRRLGYAGKLCIHPRQVPLANAAHTPDAREIDFAVRVIEADRAARAEGRGVCTVDGKMVDAPVLEAQRVLIERARRAGVAGLPEEEERR